MATEQPRKPRIGRWKLTVGLSILALVALVAGFLVWHALLAIPNVGDPFDVREFASFSIPDDQNAFTYYRLAAAKMVNVQTVVKIDHKGDWNKFFENYQTAIDKGWSHAKKDVRSWLAANRIALDLWKRGSELPDALDVPAAAVRIGRDGTIAFDDSRYLTRLALLEAARIGAEQRPADAWPWYKAALRVGTDLGRHAPLINFLVGKAIYDTAANAVVQWSLRPEIGPSDLRRALADVAEINAMTPLPSETLKYEYMVNRDLLRTFAEETAKEAGRLEPLIAMAGYRERARRSLNLVYANLLSQADRPRWQRRPDRSGKWGLFERDPALPADPQFVDPKVIEQCTVVGKGYEAKLLKWTLPEVSSDFESYDSESLPHCSLAFTACVHDLHRMRQAELMLELALQLHYREHGQFPTTLDELVKNGYVKSVPIDPLGSGAPFHYLPEADAKKGATLWSVGVDGKGDKRISIAAPGKTAK